jgi:diguanylate cyclase (GGDEF)-like protein
MSRAKSGSPEDLLVDVIGALAISSSSCMVICSQGIPVGIITEQDLVRLFYKYSEYGLPDDLTAGEVMTKDPITFKTAMDLSEAIAIMKTQNLRHLPVVSDTGKLAGLITLADMVEAYSVLVEENHKLEEVSEELHWLSMEDCLTEMPNRRAMERDLMHAEARAQRYNETYTVALIDIDFFKPYNDYYGHLKGDEALKSVASVLKAVARTSDRVFRYGGEEFLYFMPNSSIDDAGTAADRLRIALEKENFEHVKNPYGKLTISVGVALGTEIKWQDVLEYADKALYEAKETGRNRVCIARQPGIEHAQEIAHKRIGPAVKEDSHSSVISAKS